MELIAVQNPTSGNTKVGGSHTNDGSPFQRRNIHEWSRLDTTTGMLERARVQTDHWSANTPNSTHQYGKVVDSRDRSAPDGNIKQRQSKQLEVYQTQVPGGSLQVIRTQTISSSSTRWSSSTSSHSVSSLSENNKIDNKTNTSNKHQDFENLQLALNPLDLSSQKSKASVGRSGSIGGRRPPSRPRSLIGKQEVVPSSPVLEEDVDSSISKAKKTHEDSKSPLNNKLTSTNSSTENHSQLSNGFTHELLNRTKSNSIENITNPTESEDLDEYSQIQDWRRTAKIRRSLQFPKSNKNSSHKILDLPDNKGSVSKIRQELETATRLNTAFRGTNFSLDAIDQFLNSVSSSSDDILHPEKDQNESVSKKSLSKRNSFITAESLKEVRGRLRRLSSPVSPLYADLQSRTDDRDTEDDGIDEVDDKHLKIDEKSPDINSRVKSYVFGMEAMKNGGCKTGSLETRISNKNKNSNGNRTEDWYNRRKSYGFEQVLNHHDKTNLQCKIESSTDSGICQSNEIVIMPSTLKNSQKSFSTNIKTCDPKKSLFQSSDNFITRNNKSTVVNLINNKYPENTPTDPFSSRKAQEELNNAWNRIVTLKNNTNENYNGIGNERDRESVTIRIPIKNDKEFDHSSRVNLNSNWEPIDIQKRHSIAVDESKYVNHNSENKDVLPQFRRISLAIPQTDRMSVSLQQDMFNDDPTSQGKKPKKVEFCKTEVHFAAESGRVNIVETDGKPPPTQNFRRRRRYSGPQMDLDENARNGLPQIRFGDTSYEKKLFSDNSDESKSDLKEANHSEIDKEKDKFVSNTIINSTETEEDNDSTPRGILKNKPIKPKPYHLGDNMEIQADIQTVTPWGVRLRPVQTKPSQSPVWRSTVTLKNTTYTDNLNINQQNGYSSSEYSHPKEQFQVSKPVSSYVSQTNENVTGVRIYRSPHESRRASWSVTEKSRQDEDINWSENKAYSIGHYQNTEVGSAFEPRTTWPRREKEISTDEKSKGSMLSKALVVRFGSDEITNNTETITPNQSTSNHLPIFNRITLPRASLHSLKSTSLIMNTLHNQILENEPVKEAEFRIPNKLDALKKMYEDAGELSDDSEKADEEVRSYMSPDADDSDSNTLNDDSSSVLSGSWSKVRALQNTQKYRNFYTSDIAALHSMNIANGNSSQGQVNRENKGTQWEAKSTSSEEQIQQKLLFNSNKSNSNIVQSLHKSGSSSSITKTSAFSQPNITHKYKSNSLLSPSLVGLSLQNHKQHISNSLNIYEESIKNKVKPEDKPISNSINRRSLSPTKDLTNKQEKPNRNEKKFQSSSPTSQQEPIRLRHQPVQTYFGSIRSPRTPRKYSERVNVLEKRDENSSFLTNRPDLLCHANTIKETEISKSNSANQNPIYANIDEVSSQKNPYSIRSAKIIENETAILEELTKAADQILQAVNGYTDEESFRHSTDEDEETKRRKGQFVKNSVDVLDTISETKSWKQKTETQKTTKVIQNVKGSKSRVEPASSNSSIDSISRECQRNSRLTKTKVESEDKTKRKVSSDSSVKAIRARRLQRASSREALLQSHGSSSEDINTPAEIIRKPRVTRKTKVTQSTSSESRKSTISSTARLNLTDVPPTRSVRRSTEASKNKERSPITSLPEIRHKTVVSNLKNLAAKPSIKEKSKKSEDNRKKSASKSETSHVLQTTSKTRGAAVRERTGSKTTAVRPERTSSNGHVLSSRKCCLNEALSRH